MKNRTRLEYKILCANMGILPLPDIVPIETIQSIFAEMKKIYDQDREKQQRKINSRKMFLSIIPHFEKA